MSGQAIAQVAGAVSVQTDYRVRGYSVSAGRPVGIVDLSFDHPDGLYASGSAVVAPPKDGYSSLVALVGSAGYARVLAPRISADMGVSRSEYFHRVNGKDTGYTEIYAGVTTRRISTHIYYSPDYFRPGVHTVYLEAEGSLPAKGFLFSAHLGMLDYLSQPAGVSLDTQYDWRLGVSHQLGPAAVSASVSGGGPGEDRYGGQNHSKTAVVAGAVWSF